MKSGRALTQSRWLVIASCLLFAFCLTPFLFGGVVSGDSHGILLESQRFESSPLSLPDFVRSPSGSYPWHHILWFGITYATVRLISIFSHSTFVVQVILSAEAILVALLGMALCFVFLVRRMNFDAAISAATVLETFVGGYGVFAITMGGTVESLMLPAMALRLFLFEGVVTPLSAGLLALTDTALAAFKFYSLAVIVLSWPLFWSRSSRDARLAYGVTFGLLLAAFVLFKLWTWNPTSDYDWIMVATVPSVLSDLFQQVASPWSGLPFCMPVLLVLFWHERAQRRALLLKLAGLLVCMAILSLFPFFDGDVPGGRYIFPFTLVLLPEMATGISILARKAPRAAWLLPVCVLAFLPTALYSLPFFVKGELSGTGGCVRIHPALYSWKLVIAQIEGDNQVSVCYHDARYAMDTRDAASPRTAPWRVAYFLSGAHSAQYVARVHSNSPEQREHDRWGNALSLRLKRLGLGEPTIWEILGSLPAIAALWLSIRIAWCVSHGAPGSVALRKP